jgi:putative transcriptional regulator
VVEELAETDAGVASLFVGGPVEQHYLFTLHTGLPAHATSDYSSSPTDGIVFEPVFGSVEAYLKDEWATQPKNSRPSLNFYLGYAGWSPGQLEEELKAAAWLVLPADAAMVFNDDPTDGWYAALTRKGGLYQIIAQTGFRPSLN